MLDCMEGIDFPKTKNAKYSFEWVSVRERLPEKDGRYLVCTEHWSNWVGVSSLRSGVWDDSKVSHWMNLPEPPNEINTDKDGNY